MEIGFELGLETTEIGIGPAFKVGRKQGQLVRILSIRFLENF